MKRLSRPDALAAGQHALHVMDRAMTFVDVLRIKSRPLELAVDITRKDAVAHRFCCGPLQENVKTDVGDRSAV